MNKSDIILETDGENANNQYATYALKTSILGMKVSLPTISPQKNELFRARKRNMSIDSPFATYIEHVSSLEDFLENYDVRQSDYEEFSREYQDKIVNYSFDLHPNENTTEEIVNALHEIQINAESPFLFEYENDINQNENSLNTQLDKTKAWLKEQDSNKILVPVIDMKIREEGLFLRKLNSILTKYNRINVIYRSPNITTANWSDLKKFLKNNKIWCHMDCVLNRYNNDKIAHRVRLYAMGVSSTSIGFPFGGSGSNKKRISQFNTSSHTYELLAPPHLPSFAEKRDRTWINSLNAEIATLQEMREHVTLKTLYTNYIPSISSNYLVFTEGV